LTSLVDTDVAIDFMVGIDYALALFERLVSESELLLSIVSYIELREGVLKSRDRATMEHQLRHLLSTVINCDLGREVAEVAADVRLSLRSRGREMRRRALDLLIASTAIAHNAKLVTRNIKDYQDIPALVFYPTEFAKP
jgi:predicted nucleic acid-binding protein